MAEMKPGDMVTVDGEYIVPLRFRGRTHDGYSVCAVDAPGHPMHGRDCLLKTRRLAVRTDEPQREIAPPGSA